MKKIIIFICIFNNIFMPMILCDANSFWGVVDMVLCYLCITLINSRVLPRLVKISPKD